MLDDTHRVEEVLKNAVAAAVMAPSSHNSQPWRFRIVGNRHFPINDEINSGRAPIHHQLDVRVDYNWKWGPVDLTAFLDVQNVYMNESVVTYFYSYDFSQRVAFTSIPIIPSIGLRGVF